MGKREANVKNISIGKGRPLAFMCGPCVIEGEAFVLSVAEQLKRLFDQTSFSFIFKASYDKANRSSIDSFRGPGLDEGLRILEKVQKELDLPVVTDVHSAAEATAAGEIVDLIQIPAFLCRQTDILVAAGNTGKAVSIKKGQFLAPWDMENVINKVRSTGNSEIIAVDRGTSFGYNNLVSDFRAVPIMQGLNVPVCYDATHSVQLPGGLGTSSGGQREFIPVLSKAAVAVGVDALFLETHPNPSEGKSDAASMLPLRELSLLLEELQRIHEAVRE